MRLAISQVSKFGGPFLCVLACCWLSFSAFEAAKKLTTESHELGPIPNPYLFDSQLASTRLKANEIDQQLEFMVWDRERRSLALELSNLLRQQLNTEPFNFQLWRRLSFAELGAARSHKEQAFALKRALLLGKWNAKERFVLLHHCVLGFSSLESVLPNLCRTELRSLPDDIKLNWIASMAGVSLAELNAALDSAGINVPTKN